MIKVTNKAVSEIRRIVDEQPSSSEDLGLRIGVKKGGCSGMSYTMDFDRAGTEDQVIEQDGIRLLCDEESFRFLDGLTLDFHDGLMGRGFKFDNPNARKTCSCGESFCA